MARNPFYRAPPFQGYTDEVRRQLLTRVRVYLQSRAGDPIVPDADIQALDPLLAFPPIWRDVQEALDL